MSITILKGDCRELLRTLPAGSAHTCVTSPPYWGLRDYGHKGQLGLETTPEEYVQNMVEVFREVKRVLRDDGTLWLNLGDSYISAGTGGLSTKPSKMTGGRATQEEGSKRPSKLGIPGLKTKDLVGIPWRVAFALQADGWYLRSDIIWHKPNPMPESVTDRPTKAHEYIFLLTKQPAYYYDHEAIKEDSIHYATDPRADKGNIRYPEGKRGQQEAAGGGGGQEAFVTSNATRNKRSVWTVTTKPFSGAHFATFPPDLIEPCIKAGCPTGGTVLDPFGGSGTTGLVSDRLGRHAILCELNPEYIGIAERRLTGDAPLLADVETA